MNAPALLDRRADKTGQAMMSTGSVALLLKLASGSGKWTPWRVLKSFVEASHINELDLQPLVAAGWVDERKGRTDALSICITDAGNELVRNLVGWMKLKAGEVKS